MRFPNFDQEQELAVPASHAEYSGHEFEFSNSEYQSEAEEMELAAELLGVTNEAELEQFFGSLLSRAAGAASGFLQSPAGQQIAGLLKSAARQALPRIGSAIGGHFGGSTGAQLGGKLATNAGQLFGLELEGLSNEDREFEVARQFVRFGNEAVERSVQVARSGAGARGSRDAYMQAARLHAPGFTSGSRLIEAVPTQLATFPTQGRWRRRGRTVVLS